MEVSSYSILDLRVMYIKNMIHAEYTDKFNTFELMEQDGLIMLQNGTYFITSKGRTWLEQNKNDNE